jgi:WD40 repeat protein
MLAVGQENLITFYAVPDGSPIKTLTGGGTGAVRFSPDGMWLAQGGPNGINLWNLSTSAK